MQRSRCCRREGLLWIHLVFLLTRQICAVAADASTYDSNWHHHHLSRQRRAARSVTPKIAQTTVYNAYIVSNTNGYTVSEFSEGSVLRSRLALGYKAFVLQEFNDFFHGKAAPRNRLASEQLLRVKFKESTELLRDSIATYLMLDVPCPVAVNATCQAVYASFVVEVESHHRATKAATMADFIGDSLAYQTNTNMYSRLQSFLVQAGFDSSIQVFQDGYAPSASATSNTSLVLITTEASPVQQTDFDVGVGATVQDSHDTAIGDSTQADFQPTEAGDLIPSGTVTAPAPSFPQTHTQPAFIMPDPNESSPASTVDSFPTVTFPSSTSSPAAMSVLDMLPSQAPAGQAIAENADLLSSPNTSVQSPDSALPSDSVSASSGSTRIDDGSSSGGLDSQSAEANISMTAIETQSSGTATRREYMISAVFILITACLGMVVA